MESLGKKLYKSTALRAFKVGYLSIAGILLFNLVVQVLRDPFFQEHFESNFTGVVTYLWRYPEDFLIYLFTIFFPAIYYAFIRGIVFCENGMVINRGLPFFNRNVLYKNISSYKLIHPKFLMAVKRSDIDEELVFTIRNVDRVIAIFDQHNIKGELGKEAFAETMTVNKKLLIVFVVFGLALFIFQHFGGLARLMR